MKRLFIISFLLTVLVMVVINITGKPLITDAAPGGIVSYELAGSIENAQAVLESWDAMAIAYAGFNLGIDYLFLIAYSLTIFSGLMLVKEAFSPGAEVFRRSIGISAWLQFLAGALDAVENYALLKLLFGSRSDLFPPLARACAIVKFSIVGWGILLLLFSILFYFIAGRRRGNPV